VHLAFDGVPQPEGLPVRAAGLATDIGAQQVAATIAPRIIGASFRSSPRAGDVAGSAAVLARGAARSMGRSSGRLPRDPTAWRSVIPAERGAALKRLQKYRRSCPGGQSSSLPNRVKPMRW
jgi:hypothetical protein